ncbi:hypothetical protein D3C73_1432880 [compost metagenome]
MNMDGHRYDFAVVHHELFNHAADPAVSIGQEGKPHAGIELLDGSHHPHVPLGNQIHH